MPQIKKAPDTLPANFNGWDAAPDTLPPDFSGWDAAPQAQSENSVWTGVKELGSELNPVTALTGLRDAVAHPIDTIKADANARQAILDQSSEQFKNKDYVGGAANLFYGLIPFVGEGLAKRGQQFRQGETAKAIGGSVGMGINLAAPVAAKNVKIPIANKASEFLQSKAADLYQSALKPSTAVKQLAKSKAAVQTGLDQGVTVSKSGLEKLGTLIEETNQKIESSVPAGTGKTVNKYAVASRLTPLSEKFAAQANPGADLRAISKSGQEFINTQPIRIPVEDALKLKSGTYKALGSKSYGELKGASIEAQKALARGLKEEAINHFPELKGLGILDRDLLQLEPILHKAVTRIGNHQLVGISTGITAAGAEAVTQSPKWALAAATAKAVFDQPVVKSRLAIALQRAGKAQGVTLPIARARVQAYINALGQTANQATQPQAAYATQ